MNNVPRIESYAKGKRKRELITLLSNIERYLKNLDRLTDDLNVFIDGWESEGTIKEMVEMMSSSEKRRLQSAFEKIEFKIRGMKNRIMVPEYCRRKPPLK